MRAQQEGGQAGKIVQAATAFRKAFALVDLFGGDPDIGTVCQPVISGISIGAFGISTGSDVRRL
jgi:hypothetical protein